MPMLRSSHCRISYRVNFTHYRHHISSLTVLVAMQAEQTVLEGKNHELSDAFKQKAHSLQHTTKLYQALKAQVMASHVATAAGDEAEMTLQTARADRFIDRLPGTRVGSSNYNQLGGQRMGGGRPHDRNDSRSSGSSGQQQGGIGLGHRYAPHLQGHGLSGRGGTGRKFGSQDLDHSLTLWRICSRGRTVSNTTKPPSCPWRRDREPEHLPSSRYRSSVSSLTDGQTAARKHLAKLGQLCDWSVR
jgi:hypothetical protein